MNHFGSHLNATNYNVITSESNHTVKEVHNYQTYIAANRIVSEDKWIIQLRRISWPLYSGINSLIDSEHGTTVTRHSGDLGLASIPWAEERGFSPNVSQVRNLTEERF